jgi:hypothetical protein
MTRPTLYPGPTRHVRLSKEDEARYQALAATRPGVPDATLIRELVEVALDAIDQHTAYDRNGTTGA